MDNEENYAFETAGDMADHFKKFGDMSFLQWLKRFGQTPSQIAPRMGDMPPGMDEYRAQERNPVPKSPSGAGMLADDEIQGPIADLATPQEPAGPSDMEAIADIVRKQQEREALLESMREEAPGKYAASGIAAAMPARRPSGQSPMPAAPTPPSRMPSAAPTTPTSFIGQDRNPRQYSASAYGKEPYNAAELLVDKVNESPLNSRVGAGQPDEGYGSAANVAMRKIMSLLMSSPSTSGLTPDATSTTDKIVNSMTDPYNDAIKAASQKAPMPPTMIGADRNPVSGMSAPMSTSGMGTQAIQEKIRNLNSGVAGVTDPMVQRNIQQRMSAQGQPAPSGAQESAFMRLINAMTSAMAPQKRMGTYGIPEANAEVVKRRSMGQ